MGTATDPRILVANKVHQCSWCAERIMPGETYKRYRWYDGGDANTVKLHEECSDACDRAIEQNSPHYIEFSPGDFPRGCTCDHDSQCEQPFCVARRRISNAAERAGDIFKRINGRAQ